MENNDKCCEDGENCKDKTECCSGEEMIDGCCGEDCEAQNGQDMLVGTAQKFCDDVFPHIWKDHSEKLETLDKKELAKEMFFAGAIEMLASFMHQMQEANPNMQEEEETKTKEE